MRLVVQAIVNRQHAADDAAVLKREEQLDIGVREERVLLRREPLALGDAQRRDPMRIVTVAIVGVVDEPAEIAPVGDADYVDHCSNRITERAQLVVNPSVRASSWQIRP